MTYNVFIGTLNCAQSINQRSTLLLRVWTDSTGMDGRARVTWEGLYVFMAAHGNGQTIIFCTCGFYFLLLLLLFLLLLLLLLLIFFLLLLVSFFLSFSLPFSSPNLSDRRLDVYHTSIHDVV